MGTELLKVDKQFTFLLLDNKFDNTDPREVAEFDNQVSKLWDSLQHCQRFDARRQELDVEVVEDASCFTCMYEDCPSRENSSCAWRKCDNHSSCPHHGKILHIDCWLKAHRGKMCLGKTLCKQTFFDRHADKLVALFDGACMQSANEMSQAMQAAFGDAAGKVQSSLFNVEDLCECVGEAFHHHFEHMSAGLVYSVTASWAVGPAVGSLVAWNLWRSSRQCAYNELAKHWESGGKEGLSPEEFAIRIQGAYRTWITNMSVTLGTAVVSLLVKIAMTSALIAGGVGVGCLAGLAILTIGVKWGLTRYATRSGQQDARRRLRQPHCGIVAECLAKLGLVDFMNEKLEKDVKKLTWANIESNHRFLARKEHPDKVLQLEKIDDSVTPEIREQRIAEATRKFIQVQASFEILETYYKKFQDTPGEWHELLQGALDITSHEGWRPCCDEVDLQERLEKSVDREMHAILGDKEFEMLKEKQATSKPAVNE